MAVRTTKFLIRLLPGLFAIWFGVIKLFGGQFSPQSMSIEKIPGVHSAEMVFYFFGNSGLYIWVIGLVQFTGGFLILFKKTSLIGAMLCLTIFLNIMIINYSFHFSDALVFCMGVLSLCCILTLSFEFNRLKNLLIESKP
jgi:hypothetical protein